MKKLMAIILTLAMIFTMAVPVFADNATADTDVDAPIAPAPVELTKAQVKAIKPKNVKAASYSYTKIKVTWDKIEGVDGYKVYRATKKNGKYSLARTTTSADTLSYINTGRTTGKTYYYKVRGYKKIGKTTYYTKYSAVKSTYARPNKAKITKVYLPKDEHVKVTWNKVSGATGYQVYRKRTDKSTWKLFKSVSSKTTAVIDELLGKATYPWGKNGPKVYDMSDLDHNWEYKVRAYKTVNGKKVYGLFSNPVEFVPEWTIEEVYDTVWKYIESLEWPLYEAVPTYPEPNEDDEYIVPKKDGSTYHLQHVIGEYSFDGYDWYGVFSNPANGETVVPEGAIYKPYTEKGTSWTPEYPLEINRYEKKQNVVRRLKVAFESSLRESVALAPKYWDPDFDCWGGTEEFTFYYKKAGNWYKVWCLE